MSGLTALVSDNLALIVAALALALAVVVALVLVLERRIGRLEARLSRLAGNDEGRSVTGLLEAQVNKLAAVVRDLEALTARTDRLDERGRLALQRTGIVRYNPFEDTGGNQSFALALLDADGNGYVLSSLHGRSGTRVYARRLVAGRAESTLSMEEADAVRLALERPSSR